MPPSRALALTLLLATPACRAWGGRFGTGAASFFRRHPKSAGTIAPHDVPTAATAHSEGHVYSIFTWRLPRVCSRRRAAERMTATTAEATSASPPEEAKRSVPAHMRLGRPGGALTEEEEAEIEAAGAAAAVSATPEAEKPPILPASATNATITTLLEYRASGELFAALGTDKDKFALFLGHSLRGRQRPVDQTRISTRQVDLSDEGTRQALLALWRKRRLLSESRDPLDVLRSSKTFADLLDLYTDRVSAEDSVRSGRLLSFLRRHYPAGSGRDAEAECKFDAKQTPAETLAALKRLLVWFKQVFPYYYDRCMKCGNDKENSFVGYSCATRFERVYRAERTELYHCAACGMVSRFPRYNQVLKVLETKRGRCGEYSVLVMRFLEALGYTSRWVVDWTDHVWAEVHVGGRWVAVDPCEAAVDEPLLYESWGKNLTVVIAFTKEEAVDVTATYATDIAAAKRRREVGDDELAALLQRATAKLRGELLPPQRVGKQQRQRGGTGKKEASRVPQELAAAVAASVDAAAAVGAAAATAVAAAIPSPQLG